VPPCSHESAAIVLLTDAVPPTVDMLKGAKMAADHSVRIVVIRLGTPNGRSESTREARRQRLC
jgi:hypothetical protein